MPKILGLLSELEQQDNFLKQRHLFKQSPATLVDQIDRSVFNRRRRQLAFKVELLRQRMGALIAPAEDTCLVDSMPLESYKFGRADADPVAQPAQRQPLQQLENHRRLKCTRVYFVKSC